MALPPANFLIDSLGSITDIEDEGGPNIVPVMGGGGGYLAMPQTIPTIPGRSTISGFPSIWEGGGPIGRLREGGGDVGYSRPIYQQLGPAAPSPADYESAESPEDSPGYFDPLGVDSYLFSKTPEYAVAMGLAGAAIPGAGLGLGLMSALSESRAMDLTRAQYGLEPLSVWQSYAPTQWGGRSYTGTGEADMFSEEDYAAMAAKGYGADLGAVTGIADIAPDYSKLGYDPLNQAYEEFTYNYGQEMAEHEGMMADLSTLSSGELEDMAISMPGVSQAERDEISHAAAWGVDRDIDPAIAHIEDVAMEPPPASLGSRALSLNAIDKQLTPATQKNLKRLEQQAAADPDITGEWDFQTEPMTFEPGTFANPELGEFIGDLSTATWSDPNVAPSYQSLPGYVSTAGMTYAEGLEKQQAINEALEETQAKQIAHSRPMQELMTVDPTVQAAADVEAAAAAQATETVDISPATQAAHEAAAQAAANAQAQAAADQAEADADAAAAAAAVDAVGFSAMGWDEGGNGDGDGDDGGDGSHICTAAFKAGISSKTRFRANRKYGIKMRRENKLLMRGYDKIGPWLARTIGHTKAGGILTKMYELKISGGRLPLKFRVLDAILGVTVRPTVRLIGLVKT
jgi:hypothetical protein